MSVTWNELSSIGRIDMSERHIRPETLGTTARSQLVPYNTARIVCAALILASMAVLFRIVTIWQADISRLFTSAG